MLCFMDHINVSDRRGKSYMWLDALNSNCIASKDAKRLRRICVWPDTCICLMAVIHIKQRNFVDNIKKFTAARQEFIQKLQIVWLDVIKKFAIKG